MFPFQAFDDLSFVAGVGKDSHLDAAAERLLKRLDDFRILPSVLGVAFHVFDNISKFNLRVIVNLKHCAQVHGR